MAMTDWQPIETAPKDGTKIIVSPDIRIAFWTNWHQKGSGWADKFIGYFSSYTTISEPTHWQPLPDPPNKT